MHYFDINHRRIGRGEPCFIIAEAGVNHNGDLGLALQLVEAAARAGADSVKFQTFQPEEIASSSAAKADYQMQNMPVQESQIEMLRRLALGPNDFAELARHCVKHGILFLSTPFDASSATMLHEIGMTAFKIGSGEITNLPLLQSIARFGKPVILSTGMSYLGDVEAAVRALRNGGLRDIALLHCVSDYPARPADCNLRAMRTLEHAFGLPVGFSDHTDGDVVCGAAVALGACLIEKHFTLGKNLPGPDHAASLDVRELIALVKNIRDVEASLGHGRKEPVATELPTAALVRRSWVAAVDIPAGSKVGKNHIAFQRPAIGLPLDSLPLLLGRQTREAIPKGTPLSWEMFA